MSRKIQNKDELIANLSLIEYYISEGNADESEFAENLIKRGACFVAYEINSELRFAPSRFVGYANNSLDDHRKNETKDGRETNPVIDNILGQKVDQNDRFESAYLDYCQQLGISSPNNKKRKYWSLEIPGPDFDANSKLDGDFPEGRIVERKHKARERNRELVKKAKEAFNKKYGKLFCEACNFDLEKQYGTIGKGFIEAHHIIPVSEMKKGHKTKIDHLVMLCPNCHRMVHRSRPWLKVEKIQGLVKVRF